ncbi:MAG: restriction endonuclease [Planctomycetaceae bacterium]|nr:restriction endonuclease [Planctomycetaceae bacterium]
MPRKKSTSPLPKHAAETSLIEELKDLFGQRGGDKLPGNVGKSRSVVQVCRELMHNISPDLVEYFLEWDSRQDGPEPLKFDNRPLETEIRLVRIGQWEGAWALARLHHQVLLQREVEIKDRQHKGHPLCSLALVAREIGSPSLTRTFATLSSAGDLYWCHKDGMQWLIDGGYGPTMLEQFESRGDHDAWRKLVHDRLKSGKNSNTAYYLEATLALRWFGGTLFQHVWNCAKIKDAGKTFVDVLLEGGATRKKSTVKGTRFEAAAGIALSMTPGFGVDSARKTSDEQVDLVVRYQPDQLCRLRLDGSTGLVECKSSVGKVSGAELRDFGAKCLFHRVKFGILVTRTGVTGKGSLFDDPHHAELVRRRFFVDGLTLLVVSADDLKSTFGELRGLQSVLAEDHDLLVFGDRAK